MRAALASLLGVALALAGCATIESVFKSDTPPATAPAKQNSRHRLSRLLAVRARSVLGGLHHEYSLVAAAG